MTIIYLGLAIILIFAYPMILLARAMGFVKINWALLLLPILIPAGMLLTFCLGLFGFLSLFQFIIR